MNTQISEKINPLRTSVSSVCLLQRKCACGNHTATGICDECQMYKKERILQRFAMNEESRNDAPPVVHEVLRTSGQPLDTPTRTFMESRFSRDFSQVRVHNDEKAAESARAVNASAYTVGTHIVFAQNLSSYESIERDKLVAHELAHVVQQGFQEYSNSQISIQANDAHHEREASQVAHNILSADVSQWPVTRGSNGNSLLQRSDEGKDKSRQSKPKDAPRGTRPIDQSGLDREDIHKIKDGIGAGPRDWVGITPEGEVITSDSEGNAENHGPATDYLREAHPEIPSWVWPLLVVVGIVVIAGIIACFATGVCEFAAVVGGLSYATALMIIGLLKSAGIKDSGGGA